MDEAQYIALMYKDFYTLGKTDLEHTFEEVLEMYVAEGYDVEGYEDLMHKAWNEGFNDREDDDDISWF